ncbi:hypothetical protein FM120_30000 [Sphingobacterium faecium PCAi_F2.5]|nr:hypothetical protein FM120_30000 [Sphingobacterium faecium PCAi_F2.5]
MNLSVFRCIIFFIIFLGACDSDTKQVQKKKGGVISKNILIFKQH